MYTLFIMFINLEDMHHFDAFRTRWTSDDAKYIWNFIFCTKIFGQNIVKVREISAKDWMQLMFHIPSPNYCWSAWNGIFRPGKYDKITLAPWKVLVSRIFAKKSPAKKFRPPKFSALSKYDIGSAARQNDSDPTIAFLKTERQR